MTFKTDKKDESSFPFLELTVVNNTQIFEDSLGRILLLNWSGDLHSSENPFSRLYPSKEDTKKVSDVETPTINIKVVREKNGTQLPVGEFMTILKKENRFYEKIILTVKQESTERIVMYKFIESTGEKTPIGFIPIY
ncbi:hypothetical protein [Bacillus cereus]|uniref:hypothetical protein n=1 Tax=Bacillus cereus TaxID=1396 RepID=UPI00124C6A55|nr:hypothetical protein [Bacillus cereus]KAB2397330.1 hypothetical protein F8171_06600 [Bacillus cereus]